MQTQQIVRTTVQLDPELYRNVKLKMLEDDMTFKEMVEQGLNAVLQGKTKKKAKRQKKVRFGGYDLGEIYGDLSRESIYDEIEEHII